MRVKPVEAEMGHEDRFLPRRLNARCPFNQRTFAGAGTGLAYSRLVPSLDRLMLADYHASIRMAETRK